MKQMTTRTISGCVIWIISIGSIMSCILPISIVIGSVTSFSEFAVKTTGTIICSDGSTPESHSYEATTTDEFGNSTPATGVELRCVDQTGTIVRTDPVGYAFLWDGIFAIIGLVISAMLGFMLAAPLSVLIGKLFNRGQRSSIATNVER